jgi:DNA repair protein RadA/Sms
MAAATSRYVCQQCGAEHRKWMGRCDACGAWNAVTEEAAPARSGTTGRSMAGGRAVAIEELAARTSAPAGRMTTGIAEFDRVLGGGLVPASAVLVAGDPGIGKSTLLLQAAAALASGSGASGSESGVLYVSGEEATDQLRMRAARLGLEKSPVKLATATSVADIAATVEAIGPAKSLSLLIIDSIQTMHVGALESAPGTVAQVRAAAQSLIALAKARGLTVVMVGHVTKEGQIAGPRVLEHMVDAVLYFEGERGHQFRILRAVKNRFGPTDEIGVFEMTDGGLGQVANPSAMFLGRDGAGEDGEADAAGPVPGAAVFAGIEGTRPVLVEIQALVAPSALAVPRRAVVGWDSARLAMVAAVLDARCGLTLSGHDVYLSVAGGLRIREPAADLAVAAALISSLANCAAPEGVLFFGEVGLSGEVRPVSGREARLKEAAKLGFTRAFAPRQAGTKRSRAPEGLPVEKILNLRDILPLFGVEPGRKVVGITDATPIAGRRRTQPRQGN